MGHRPAYGEARGSATGRGQKPGRIIISIRVTSIVLAFAVFLAGCSPLGTLNALYVRGDYVSQDAAYGPGPRHGLTVYGPPAAHADALRPVVLFLYGGSWKSGHRRDYRFVAEALVERGYVVVIPDYRVWPEVRFPAFVEDAAAAFAWTRAHVRDHGGDPGRIFVAGHSAGAHMALLLALDPHYLQAAGETPAAIRGVTGLAGPYSFDPLATPSVKAIFETVPDVNAARPVARVRADAPPALLLHGGDDGTVWPKNSSDLAAALRAVGAPVESRVYPGVSHAGIVLAFLRPFRMKPPVLDDMDRFMRAILAAAPEKDR